VTQENGYPGRPRHAIPTLVFALAVVVAVGSTSGLIWFLFQRTEGPAPVLRTFAERVRDGDCPGSYRLLEASTQATIAPEDWCELLEPVQAQLDPGFRVTEMRLREDIAELSVRGRLSAEPSVWRLRKAGRSWRVLGPTGGFEALLEQSPAA
ncbi:MAG TPA: hypothetical protein VM638_07675, partial [Actinomycetota bacterium]|nr:hypothetical protein [Actinomycetota bacterium]